MAVRRDTSRSPETRSAGFGRVLVVPGVSKTVLPVFAPNEGVFSHALTVVAYDDDAHFGLLTSAIHWWWAVSHGSSMRTDVRYTPSDCFETFPQPKLTAEVEAAGGVLHEFRAHLMLQRGEGLTKTYNRVVRPGRDPGGHRPAPPAPRRARRSRCGRVRLGRPGSRASSVHPVRASVHGFRGGGAGDPRPIEPTQPGTDDGVTAIKLLPTCVGLCGQWQLEQIGRITVEPGGAERARGTGARPP